MSGQSNELGEGVISTELEGQGFAPSSFETGGFKEQISVDRAVSEAIILDVKNTLIGRGSVLHVADVSAKEVLFADAAKAMNVWGLKNLILEHSSRVEALSRQDQMEVVRKLLHHVGLGIPDIKGAFPSIEWNAELADYLIQPGSVWSVYLYPKEFGELPVEIFLKLLQLKGHEALYAVRRYGALTQADQEKFEAELERVSATKNYSSAAITLLQDAAQ